MDIARAIWVHTSPNFLVFLDLELCNSALVLLLYFIKTLNGDGNEKIQKYETNDIHIQNEEKHGWNLQSASNSLFVVIQVVLHRGLLHAFKVYLLTNGEVQHDVVPTFTSRTHHQQLQRVAQWLKVNVRGQRSVNLDLREKSVSYNCKYVDHDDD